MFWPCRRLSELQEPWHRALQQWETHGIQRHYASKPTVGAKIKFYMCAGPIRIEQGRAQQAARNRLKDVDAIRAVDADLSTAAEHLEHVARISMSALLLVRHTHTLLCRYCMPGMPVFHSKVIQQFARHRRSSAVALRLFICSCICNEAQENCIYGPCVPWYHAL